MTELIGSLVILLGSIFLLLAGIGVVRMPDSYNRIQTGTKATTLGLILVLVGVGIHHPAWSWKLILLIYFVLLSNPASSHALARAAHSLGIFKADATLVDDLESFEGQSDKTENTTQEKSEC